MTGPAVLNLDRDARIGWWLLGGAAAAVFLVYWQTILLMIDLWEKNPFGHGYFIVPAAVYLIWRQRADLALVRPTPSASGVVATAVVAFVWLLGNLSATGVVQQVALVVLLMTVVWAVAGWQALSALRFPLGLLLFALPIGDRLVPILQDAMASFAVHLLRLVGFPVLLEGHYISIPGSQWEVAQACSGINYLVTSMMVGYVYAGLFFSRWQNRLGCFVASALLPLVANGFRVFTTILIASLGWTGIAAGLEHNIYGLVVFAVVTYALFAICGRWTENSRPRASLDHTEAMRSSIPLLPVAILAVIVAAAAPLLGQRLKLINVPAEYQRPKAAHLSGSWRAVGRGTIDWSPRFAAPSAVSTAFYEANGNRVQLSMAYYRADEPAVKLATVETSLFQPPWYPTAQPISIVPPIDGAPFTIRETQLRSPAATLLVWSWYGVGDRTTSSDYVAKILLAKARLLRRPEGAAVMAIATDGAVATQSRVVLTEFLQHLSWSLPGASAVSVSPVDRFMQQRSAAP